MTGGPPITETDRQLRSRAASWAGGEDVRVIAQTEGLDFATAVLHERLLRDPENAGFFKTVCSPGTENPIACDLIGVVPGAFYQKHRNTGADGARILSIARQLGCEAERIPVNSFGKLGENAEIILKWAEAQPGKKIALISLSKGSAEVKCALASPRAFTVLRQITWISFSGMVQGTPLVDWLRMHRFRWWAVRLMLRWGGHDSGVMEQLRHGPDTMLSTWPSLSKKLRVVHVYGFPLEKHLHHRWAPRGYRRLAPLGPNDGGGILLDDLSQLPGIVCPIWGADHYLSPAWDATELFQHIVAAALSLPLHANQ